MDEPGPARLVVLPEQLDERGSLVVIEGRQEVQFDISRVFFSYDVPPHVVRGGHAHQELQEFIIALCGSFTVVVDDSAGRSQHVLDQPNLGLYVPPMNWIELEDFSAGAVCLVLASLPYNEADYYRNYDVFIREKLSSG
jgi:dTDP-4-dehydrorhamnose 3,5-epimerase-like enzyme